MPAPTTPMPIGADAQEAVALYFNSAISLYATSFNIRSQMVRRDLAYYGTNDTTENNQRAKEANNSGDVTKIQNVTVPVVMPQVESRLAYLQETFLSGHPVFSTVAPPDQKDAISQMDAVIEDNSTRGAWPNELLKTMRDGLKYDFGAIEVVWEDRKIFSVTTPQQDKITQGTAKETFYAGNFLRRLDPYNVILDTRVSPEEVHTRGEFAGYTEIISRIELKKRMEDLNPLGSMNFRKAFEAPGPGTNIVRDINSPYFIPSINPDALLPLASRQEHNWMSWAGLVGDAKDDGINYQNSYEFSVLYARVLPSDFKMHVKNRNHVQIWKFILVNRKIVIFAERQTNAHNLLPIIICKPSNDGMAWQSKSFAENVVPIQSISSALVNSALESQRRKVYDRLLYDPSKVNKKDIDQISSVSRIPVKSSQYGKGIADAVYQIPYRDEGVADIMMLSQQVTSMGDVVNGQNRVQQGQFQKGNKTRKEFDTVMYNASNRERMMAMGLEYTFYQPIKQIVLSNILQYQPPTTLINEQTGASTPIDPTVLRQANLKFKLADGFMPAEKLVSMDMMAQVFQAATSLPQVSVEYDLMGMWTYSMALQGANWLKDFKRPPDQQQQYLAQMQAAATAAGTRQPNQPAAPTGTQQ